MTHPSAPKTNLQKNEDLCAELKKRLAENALAGTPKAVERQHAKNKLTIPERLDLLFDKGAPRVEVGALAASDMYSEFGGGITSAGVRTVVGVVQGRDVMVVANDSMVKAGAWFPMTIRKILRAQQVAMENHLPLIYLVDSAGVFLPLQEGIFPDHDHAGRIFYNNSRISAMGIPQVAAIVGGCVAGGAYLPILADEILIVKGTGSVFLAGPYLVEAAIGERVDAETLGGAATHCEVSGVCDYEEESEQSCIARIREIARTWKPGRKAGLGREKPEAPEHPDSKLLEIFPADRTGIYDMREVLRCIVDRGSMVPYKEKYGKTLICTTARVDGWNVGIVANQRGLIRSGGGETQIGGVIYSDAADKAARFILSCNQKGIPIVFLQDVTGFMVGTRAERGGIIKDGAKLVNAVSNSRVPLYTFILGNSNGAGNYALCGRAFGGRFVYSWPQGTIAVMGGEQAGRTLLSLEKQRRADKPMSPEEEKEFLARTVRHYNSTASAYHAASRLWTDGIIDPRGTRAMISRLVAIADNAPLPESYSLGVFQT